MFKRASLIALALFLSWLPVSLAAGFTGRVVGIIDGDTIEVLHHQQAERIRLNRIDCPDKGQAYGQKAKDAVADLAFGKEVSIQTHGLDEYGGTVTPHLFPPSRPTSEVLPSGLSLGSGLRYPLFMRDEFQLHQGGRS